MSWMQKLYETYEKAQNIPGLSAEERILPVSHVTQRAHVEIVLDKEGNFSTARMLGGEDTLIPATEDSAARSGKIPPPHPLCDKIQYIAKDYPAYGGEKSFFEEYRALLSEWNQAYPHKKLQAIINYINNCDVIADLLRTKIFHADEDGKLLTSWPTTRNKPEIFKRVKSQGEAFVRWVIEIPGQESHTWKDKELMDSWSRFAPSRLQKRGICFITGEDTLLGTKHPRGIRYPGDGAKLISSNDDFGYTFRGRFMNAEQACSIGYEVSQKAHLTLHWLIKRQAFRNEDQVVVAWDVSGEKLPPIAENSLVALFAQMEGNEATTSTFEEQGTQSDLGQEYALRLKKKIAGHRAHLDKRNNIVVMGLDSSTPGRMAVTFYRELDGSEFLTRLEDWHLTYAWLQYSSKKLQFDGAPAPKEIAEAAFGRWNSQRKEITLDSKLSKATVERILPCIIDGNPIPWDLVRSACNRAANRIDVKNEAHEAWEKTLGIACALYKGFYRERGYQMSLEKERTSRDYLYGRLLAVAERMEAVALGVAGEIRDTNAAKLMQRFSERPCSTWLQIEQSLVPYKTRLQSRRPAFLNNMTNLLDEIHSLFDTNEYMKDTPLSGEFLLAYHCQRRELRNKTKDETDVDDANINTDEEE